MEASMSSRQPVRRFSGFGRPVAIVSAAALLVLAGIGQSAAGTAIAPEPRAALTYANGSVQEILDGAQVTPVSTIVVPTTVKGSIADLNVKLRSLDHQSPDDLAVMLVGPQGQALVLMGDAGNTNTIVNTFLTFDDEASGQLPNPGNIISGTYKPSDFLINPGIFTSGAPYPNVNNLAGFKGTDPRGTWALYVLDDTLNNANGRLASGWELVITTTNTKPQAAKQRYKAVEDKELSVNRANGVLRNAKDAEGTRTLRVYKPGEDKTPKGTIKIKSDGSFTFKPKKGATGRVIFPYTIIDDGGLKDTSRVIIMIDKKIK
jgi:subtilisin-like proprotein convertase family protein